MIKQNNYINIDYMSINLNLPSLDHNPVLLAEIRPNKIAEFIERIPFNNIFSAATVLLEEMQILNRQKVSADSRTKALELYRPAVIRITDELSKQYISNNVVPMQSKVKSCASAAELLWLELSYGYKMAWVDTQNKRLSIGTNKTSALIIQRAVDSLNQLCLVYYNIYFTPPASIWSDLHQLYFSAVQQNLDMIEVSEPQDKNNVGSVNLAYVHTLLVALANPQHLAKADIQRVFHYLSNLAELGIVRGIGSIDDTSGLFLIKLDSNKPPIPFLKSQSTPNASNDILLITLDIARKMHQHLQLLKSGKLPPDNILPADAVESHYEDLLTYLIKHLGATPKRLFSRAKKDNKVHLVFGIADIHQTLDSSTKNTTKISVWQVQNTSASGYALKKFQSSEVSVKVGDFVTMKESTTSDWSIAVLRWIIADEQNQLNIGLQLIAPNVNAISIKSAKLTHFENALILPEISGLKQPMTIVASRGIYSPALVIDMMQDGIVRQVLATKLIERTASVERFQFSWL